MSHFNENQVFEPADTWFISDLHFGHDNVLKFEEGRHSFANIEEHDKTIIANWFSLVQLTDTVFFLGDAAMPRTKLSYVKECFKDLPGKIVWICGNHDYHVDEAWQRELKRVANIIEFTAYKEIFVKCKEVTNYPMGYDYLRKLVLFHYPIAEHNGAFRDTYHIYGHTHKNVYPIKNAYSAAACLTDYKPVQYDWLKKKIEENNEGLNRSGKLGFQPSDF
jgi:calcineurin-like phosphoesterase family protein